MEAALGWLGDIVRWIGTLFPRLTNIRSTHGAVKFKHGRAVAIGPGLVWHWPITTDLHIVPTARRTLQLAAQTVTGASGWPVVVAAIVVYRIVDVVAACGGNYEIRATIEDTAQRHLFEATDGTLSERGHEEISALVTGACADDLSEHGVDIERVALIQRAAALPIKTFADWAHANEDEA